MIKKLWDAYHKLTDPVLKPFWAIRPVWFRDLLTNVTHGLGTVGLAALTLWWFGSPWYGYVLGVVLYTLKEFYVDRKQDPGWQFPSADTIGDIVGPIVLGGAFVWLI